MEQESLSKQAKQLEKYIYNLPAARKLNMLSSKPRETIVALRDAVTAAQGAMGRYHGSEDTVEQAQALSESIEQFGRVGELILLASQYDLLDVTDVAHLSALNEYIIDQLK